ncbi:MAG: 6-bladed beta-propeller, partial [Acidobacteriota bacterium]
IRGTDVAIGDLKGRVTIIDKDNKLVAQLGDSGNDKKQATNKITPDQWVDGQFIAPHGLSWDGKGNLYVSEWNLSGRVVKLKRVK